MSGLLGSAPEGAIDESVLSEDAGDAGQEQTPAEPAPPPPPDRVALTEKKPSRREQAAMDNARKALEGEIAPIRDTLRSLQEERARERQESAERERRLMEMLSQQRAQPQQQEGPRQKTADEMIADADKALTDGRISEYQRLLVEAGAARAREEFVRLQRSQPQMPQQPQGMPPQLQAVFMSTPEGPKVLSHERGMQMAVVKDKELELMGIPDGPDRWSRAIKLAHGALYPAEGGKTFTTDNKQALSGVPTSRGGAAPAKGKQVSLPAGYYEKWGAPAGMSREEYAREYAALNPGAIVDE